MRSRSREPLSAITTLLRLFLCLLLVASPRLAGAEEGSFDLVELVPPGSVQADGTTPVHLSFLALGADGSPLEGLKARVTPSLGSATKPRAAGDGRYGFTYTPPLLGSPQVVDLSLSGRTSDKRTVERVFQLHLVPGLPAGVSIQADPPVVVLGQGATSTLSLQIDLGPDADLSLDDLEVRAHAGSVANLTHLGGGRVTALYTAPSVNYPHLEIIVVADRRSPDRIYDQLTIPLVGRANFPVTAAAGATVLMSIGEREFGPVVADAAGRAEVPVEVAPGSTTAVVTTPQGSSEIDLGIPPYARLAFLPLHQGLPADPRQSFPIRFMVAAADGGPDAEARPTLMASLGTLSEPVYEANGIFRADYTPPAVLETVTLELLAALPEQPPRLQRKASMLLVPAAPSSVELDLSEGSGGGGDAREARLTVHDTAGQPALGRSLLMNAVGAETRGAVRELGEGRYSGAIIAGEGPFEVWTHASCRGTGNPVRRLLLFSGTDSLPSDAWTSTLVTVVALDGLGHPVPGVAVRLEQLSGDGSFPVSATTGNCGVAQVGYTAGITPGLTTLRASFSGVDASTSILQGPRSFVGAASLAPSGSEAGLAALAAWKKRVPVHRFDALPLAAVATVVVSIPPVATAAPGSPITALDVSVEPSTARPGSTVTVNITAKDASGKGVAGHTLELLSSVGATGEPADLGGGRYRASVAVPADQDAEVKITVSTSDGAQSRFLRVPVSDQASAWGTASRTSDEPATEPEQPQVAPAPGQVAAEQPEPRRERKPSTVDHRWFRVRVAGVASSYGYQYEVYEQPRPLLAEGDPVPFGTSLSLVGGSRALVPDGEPERMVVPAVDLQLRAWLPMFAYLGADLRFRGSYLGVDTDSFAQAGEGVDLAWFDSYLTAMVQGRYYHDLGDHRVWLGGAVGTVTTALPLPAHWTRDGERALWFFPWGFTSATFGARGGAELGMGVEVQVEL